MPVGEIAPRHALLAFGLDFVKFKRGLLAAAHQQEAIDIGELRRAQAFGHRIDRDNIRRPDVKVPPPESGKGARPGLEATQPVSNLGRIATEVDASVVFLKDWSERGARVILRNRANLVRRHFLERLDQ